MCTEQLFQKKIEHICNIYLIFTMNFVYYVLQFNKQGITLKEHF